MNLPMPLSIDALFTRLNLSRWTHLAICVLLALAAPAFGRTEPAAADGVGAVSVTVIDWDDQPMAGVRVELIREDLARGADTDTAGRCQFDELPAATYELRVARDGYQTVEYPHVEVSAGRATTIEVQLTPLYSGPTGLVPVCEAAAGRGMDPDRWLQEQCQQVGAEPAVEKMRELGERSLKSGASDASFEAYRFIWDRSFHMPVVVSVSVHGGVATLKTHQFPGRDGRDWGEPLPTRERTLSRDELRALREQVALSDFWRLPSSVVKIGDGGLLLITLDGSGWTIEAARDGRYHTVSREGSQPGVREIGELLLDLTGVEFDNRY